MTRRPVWALALMLMSCDTSDDPKATTPTECNDATCDSGTTSDTDTVTTPTLADNFGVEETEGKDGCDNLLEDCAYPFPSRAFVRDGHLSFHVDALPLPEDGPAFDASVMESYSAFGAVSPILFQLPGAELPLWQVFDSARSLDGDSPVVVVDAATGEVLPHWIETDWLSPEFEEPLFVIRPAGPWPRGTEIVVGVRGFDDASGNEAPTPPAFAALRDQTVSEWVGVHERRDHYEATVFPALESAGILREELQLAWSFPTMTTEESTWRMIAVRDAIFDALPAGGPDFQIDEILTCTGVVLPEGCDPNLRVIVDGTVFVPSVVLPPDDLGVRMIRLDDDGQPLVEGTEAWHFRLQLPNTAFDGPNPVPVLQYGHGFLGSYEEGNNGWLRELAERQGMGILATSMQGMNEDDIFVWLPVLTGAGGRFPHLIDLAMQGVANQLVQQRMMSTSLADNPPAELLRGDGTLAWDPSTIWYHGNSQGGSVGTVVMATSLDVTRGDLGVPGSGYPFLLHRSSVFETYASALSISYDGEDAVPHFLALLGTGWDDFDPLAFAPHITTDPLPGTPPHEVLLHVAKEDQQVHNEASFILGRATGAVLATPAVRPVFGLEERAYPFTAPAALIEVDFMIPDDPTPLDPPDGDESEPNEGDTHGWLRKWEPAQDQMLHFFRTGEFIDVCGGQACVTSDRP